MGLFSKERHGRMETVAKGYVYNWIIPDFHGYSNAILDSPIVRCGLTGVDFHFHLTVSSDGNISVYMHYKDTPIPKYTYYLGTKYGALPRQHTAYRIPPLTERCGHCNVVHRDELLKLIPEGGDQSLYVHFQWDVDKLQLSHAPEAELVVKWTVDDIHASKLTPLTSKGFALNNAIYALRVDELPPIDGRQDVMVFVFAKEGNIMPHSLQCLNRDGDVVVELPAAEEAGAMILRCPKDDFLSAFPPHTALTVVASFIKYNPLDALNDPGSAEKKLNGGDVKTIDIGDKGRTYAVLEDDI